MSLVERRQQPVRMILIHQEEKLCDHRSLCRWGLRPLLALASSAFLPGSAIGSNFGPTGSTRPLECPIGAGCGPSPCMEGTCGGLVVDEVVVVAPLWSPDLAPGVSRGLFWREPVVHEGGGAKAVIAPQQWLTAKSVAKKQLGRHRRCESTLFLEPCSASS